MEFTMEHYEQSAACLRSRIGDFTPEVFLVPGSGLGFLAEEVTDPVASSLCWCAGAWKRCEHEYRLRWIN